MKYKIVFFDIDGTLINTKSKIPASTKRAVAELQRNGVITVIATGRPIYEAKKIMEEVQIENIISTNGGQVNINGERIINETVKQEVVEEILSKAYGLGAGVSLLGTEGAHHTDTSHPVYAEFIERFGLTEVRGTNSPQEEVGGIQIITTFLRNVEDEKEFLFAKEHLHMVPWRNHISSGNYIDFYPLKQSKAKGIEIVLDKLGLSSDEAVAFGDGLNDLEMLGHVGMGIAMGNGETRLKEKADLVTEHVDNDGIEKALIKLGLIQTVSNK